MENPFRSFRRFRWSPGIAAAEEENCHRRRRHFRHPHRRRCRAFRLFWLTRRQSKEISLRGDFDAAQLTVDYALLTPRNKS